MKNLKNKKGVSLIILIITIIIMVILATTVILTISNTGIIDKANKAKQDSDSASLKEYVSILQAEWELMSKTERAATGASSSTEYVNAKLTSEGYNLMLNELGKLQPIGAVLATKAGLEIGDEIQGYNDYITVSSDWTSGKENNIGDPDVHGNYYESGEFDGDEVSQEIESKKFTTWRYVGLSNDGKVMIAPDMTDKNIPTISLSGTGGYYNGPDELNTICGKLYTTTKGTARSMNIEDVNNILEYTGPKGGYLYWNIDDDDDPNNDKWMPLDEPIDFQSLEEAGYTSYCCSNVFSIPNYYTIKNETGNDDINQNRTNLIYYSTPYWLASSACSYDVSYCLAHVRLVQDDIVGTDCLFYTTTVYETEPHAIRPIVTLNSDVTLTKGSNGVWKIN